MTFSFESYVMMNLFAVTVLKFVQGERLPVHFSLPLTAQDCHKAIFKELHA
jgi:hypothetical protein